MLSTDDDDTEEAALLSGEWYISVMTDDCPSGIIRGQLTNVRIISFFFFLNVYHELILLLFFSLLMFGQFWMDLMKFHLLFQIQMDLQCQIIM